MKRILKRILIMTMAVVFACSIQLSVSAAPSIGDGLGGLFGDLINDMMNNLNPNNTTTTAPETTTTETPNDTTTDPNATTNPVNTSGTGTITTTSPTTPNTYQPDTTLPTQLTTAEPVIGEEDSSFSYESSLSDLLEEDSAAIIVQTPTENFTIGGLVVNNGERKDGIEWQQIVLIAAAVLFVILTALVIALLVQRGKKSDDDKYEGISTESDRDADAPSGPVPVEVVTPERIAELLGAATAKKTSGGINFDGLSSDDSAAAIKSAALMGQLGSYSDPLIRKYTEEPVRFSPISQMSVDGVSAADILEATDSLLNDITGNEKYAADTRGLDVFDGDLDAMLSDTKTKICPECSAPVSSGDVFCHSCGAYVG